VETSADLLDRFVDAPPGTQDTIRTYNLGYVSDVLNLVRARILDELGLAESDIIHVPVLFNRKAWSGLGLRAVAITPDLANGAFFAPVYIAPDNFLHSEWPVQEEDLNYNFQLDFGEDTNNNGMLDTLRDPFHYYLDAIPLSVGVVYIDDWSIYHIGEGEIHCSSNEIRDIPPDGAGDVAWWDIDVP